MPARKTDRSKVLAGTFRGDRVNSDAPAAQVKAPPCPAHLTGLARDEWKRITKLLVANRVMSELHLSAVAHYCQGYKRSLEISRRVDAAIAAGAEPEAINKLTRLEIQASAEMRQREGLLGLTPADQARVKAAPPDPEKDPLAKLREGR